MHSIIFGLFFFFFPIYFSFRVWKDTWKKIGNFEDNRRGDATAAGGSTDPWRHSSDVITPRFRREGGKWPKKNVSPQIELLQQVDWIFDIFEKWTLLKRQWHSDWIIVESVIGFFGGSMEGLEVADVPHWHSTWASTRLDWFTIWIMNDWWCFDDVGTS